MSLIHKALRKSASNGGVSSGPTVPDEILLDSKLATPNRRLRLIVLLLLAIAAGALMWRNWHNKPGRAVIPVPRYQSLAASLSTSPRQDNASVNKGDDSKLASSDITIGETLFAEGHYKEACFQPTKICPICGMIWV